MEEYYKDMVAEGIDIPFNQLDVHIKEENTAKNIKKVDVKTNEKEVK